MHLGSPRFHAQQPDHKCPPRRHVGNDNRDGTRMAGGAISRSRARRCRGTPCRHLTAYDVRHRRIYRNAGTWIAPNAPPDISTATFKNCATPPKLASYP